MRIVYGVSLNELTSMVISFSLGSRWWSTGRSERAKKLEKISKWAESWKKSGGARFNIYESLRNDCDIIFWFMAEDPATVSDARFYIEKELAGFAKPRHGMLSVFKDARKRSTTSEYKYFVAYPMSKDPSWYLLPEAERKSIIAAHVKIAIESSNNYGVISYTTESFGIGDWEFVVIYELRNIAKWVAVTEELRHAEARKWIRNETPILTGIKRIDGLIS